MKKVFIGVGHGGKDPGAVKFVKESEANLNMALGLKEELERHGIKVGISRIREEDDPLYEEIKEANVFQPDCAVEVHNNAGGGDGFEVFRQTNGFSTDSIRLAHCIEKRVTASGQKSRGLKTKINSAGYDWFGWCREVRCPAVLCEGFFVDGAADHKDYDTSAKQRAYGKVYALGVLDYLGIKYNPQTELDKPDPEPEKPAPPPKNQLIYTVQVGAFADYDNAKALKDKLTDMGYYTLICGVAGKYRVWVGKFETQKEAKKTAADLKKKGFGCFVTKMC